MSLTFGPGLSVKGRRWLEVWGGDARTCVWAMEQDSNSSIAFADYLSTLSFCQYVLYDALAASARVSTTFQDDHPSHAPPRHGSLDIPHKFGCEFDRSFTHVS